MDSWFSWRQFNEPGRPLGDRALGASHWLQGSGAVRRSAGGPPTDVQWLTSRQEGTGSSPVLGQIPRRYFPAFVPKRKRHLDLELAEA